LRWTIIWPNVAGRSGFETAGRQGFIVAQAQKQHPDIRMDSLDAPGGLKTAQIRSHQIHQHNIGPQSRRLVNCLQGRVGFADNLDERSFLNQALDAFTEQNVLIADENPDFPVGVCHVVT